MLVSYMTLTLTSSSRRSNTAAFDPFHITYLWGNIKFHCASSLLYSVHKGRKGHLAPEFMHEKRHDRC